MREYQDISEKAEAPSVQGYGSGTLGSAPTPIRRRTAWDALRDLVSAARLRANQLEALQRALPQELPFVADEGLQRIFDQEYARFHSF